MSTDQRIVDGASKAIRTGRWIVVAVASVFSLVTVGPTMAGHMPAGFGWAGYLLPIALDASVVTVASVDDALHRLGGKPGFWGVMLRVWVGLATIAANIYDAIVKGDPGGVLLHAITPVTLLLVSEASSGWGRAITRATDEKSRKEAEADAVRARSEDARIRSERARQAEDEAAAEAAEKRRLAAAEEAEERAARRRSAAAREALDAEAERARIARETAAHAAQLKQAEAERAEAARVRELREAADRAQAERDRTAAEQRRAAAEQARQREAEQQAAKARQEAAEKAARDHDRAVAEQIRTLAERAATGERLTLEEELDLVAASLEAGMSQRQIGERIGRSPSTVAERVATLRQAPAPTAGLALVKEA